MKLSELFRMPINRFYRYAAMDADGVWLAYSDQPIRSSKDQQPGMWCDGRLNSSRYLGNDVYIGPKVEWYESLIDLDQFER